MRVVGVDPGITGALCLISSGGGRSNFPSIQIVDVPITGEKKQRRIDYRAYRDIIREWAPDYVYFENVRGFLGQGLMAASRFSHTIGAMEGIAACEVDNCVLVLPQIWKKKFNLLHSDKNDSRDMIKSFFPEVKYFDRVMDHNRADAGLIALYGCDRVGMVELRAG